MSVMESLPMAQELVVSERQRALSLIASEVLVRETLDDFDDFSDLSGEQQYAFGD
jgi:hypothetical protein